MYYPTEGRKIRQVFDLITDEKKFYFSSLDNKKFLGLKVISRNGPYKEIPFLEEISEKSYNIVFNLGDIEHYNKPIGPIIKDFELNNNSNLRHLKLEVEYILIDFAKTELSKTTIKDKIVNLIIPTKYKSFVIEGNIQPEFYITLPKGWIICKGQKNEGEYVQLEAVNGNDEPIKILLNNEEYDKFILYPPFTKTTNGIKTYNYLIHSESYKEIQKTITENTKIKYMFTYKSQLSTPLLALKHGSFSFIIISIALLLGISYSLCNSIQLKTGSILGMSYLIVLLSFIYYSITIRINDGYYLGDENFDRYFITSMIFSISIALAIIILCI